MKRRIMAFEVLRIKFLEIKQIYDAKLMCRLYFLNYVINIHFSLNEIEHKLDYYKNVIALYNLWYKALLFQKCEIM